MEGKVVKERENIIKIIIIINQSRQSNKREE